MTVEYRVCGKRKYTHLSYKLLEKLFLIISIQFSLQQNLLIHLEENLIQNSFHPAQLA